MINIYMRTIDGETNPPKKQSNYELIKFKYFVISNRKKKRNFYFFIFVELIFHKI